MPVVIRPDCTSEPSTVLVQWPGYSRPIEFECLSVGLRNQYPEAMTVCGHSWEPVAYNELERGLGLALHPWALQSTCSPEGQSGQAVSGFVMTFPDLWISLNSIFVLPIIFILLHFYRVSDSVYEFYFKLNSESFTATENFMCFHPM